MSRFNKKNVGTKTVNLAGGTAYAESPKLALVSLLLTTFVKGEFYRTEKQTEDQIKQLLGSLDDKRFAAQAAIYARTKLGMRSASHVLAGEIAGLPQAKGTPWVRHFFNKIVLRPDDISEILAFYLHKYGNAEGKRPIPNAMKKGFGWALRRFDAYQLAKYKMENKDWSLVDLINVLRPKPSVKNREALHELVQDRLVSLDTFQAMLSQGAQEVDAETGETIGRKSDEEVKEMKSTAWSELVQNRKIGYMALLKNLRNIIETKNEVTIECACDMLTDEHLVRNSLVMPFRFVTAYAEVEKMSTPLARTVLSAISNALDIACANVPVFGGRTLVVLDESGSMGTFAFGSKEPFSIGALFAAALIKSNNADFMMFSDTARFLNLNPKDSITTLVKLMGSQRTAAGTNFNSIFDLLSREKNLPYERIIILSDMQGWMAPQHGLFNVGGAPSKTFAAYKTVSKSDPRVYSFDLKGYGTLQFPERNVYAVAGWSEKVFDFMKMLERDRNVMITEIEKIWLPS